MPADTPKYAIVAEALRDQIRAGSLPAGSRLPSLRDLTERHGVSLVTASRALHELEREGRIQARTRARFRVCAAPDAAPNPAPPAEAVPVQADLLQRVMRALDPRAVEVPLGGIGLDPAWLPHAALRRSEARLHRHLGARAYEYEPAPGLERLRRQIALRLGQGGPPLSAREVTLTAGCLQAINLALDACTRRGDRVLVESPTFPGLLQTLQRRGLAVLEVPQHPVGGLRADEVAAALRLGPVAAACLTPSFHNPSGACTPVNQRRAIGQVLAAHDVPLIEDDVFGELGHRVPRLPPMIALCPQADVITCGSVSKTLAPGLRLGWAVRRRRLRGQPVSDLAAAQFAHGIGAPTLAQHLVAEWMEGGAYDRHLRRLRQHLPAQLAAHRRSILAHFPAGTGVELPSGGFLLWVRLPRAFDPVWLIRAAQDLGVGLMPGAAFQVSPSPSPWLRLSAGLRLTPRVDRGLQDLGRLLQRDHSLP